MGNSPDAVEAGHAALKRGEWDSVKACFEAALETAESAEALDGLGQALWWLNDVDTAIALREHAYVGPVRSGERSQAARIALRLSHEQATTFGNRAAANG